MALLIGGYGAGEAAASDCAVAPSTAGAGLVFHLEAGTEAVSPLTQEQTVGIICGRLRAIGFDGALVEARGSDEIGVTLPQLDKAESLRAIEVAGAGGQTYFYDWEPALIGQEWVIGGHPGRQPPARALREAQREWKRAGRTVHSWEDEQLIAAGALPTLYGAVKLASEQRPRNNCARCSASTPRFYLFDARPGHRLLAGPADSRDSLHVGSGEKRRAGIVLRVPVGTVVASENPTTALGLLDTSAAPGWFALRDRPALNGTDLTEASALTGYFGEPTVGLGFTARGRIAFRRLTRAIAERGRAEALGKVRAAEAAAISGHLGVVVDGEVRSRPIINFVEAPRGIDPRVGAEISGGFRGFGEAKALAAILNLGPLPVAMTRIR